MGGVNSGRVSFKPSIEASYSFSLSQLKKSGFFTSNGKRGLITWFSEAKWKVAERNGKAIIETRLNETTWELSIDFETEKHRVKQTIKLVRDPMQFGGFRFYAICPLSFKRCSNLVFVFRRGIFTSVKASGYLYASQRESDIYKLKRKMEKAYEAHVNQSPYNRKPKKQKLWLKAVETEAQFYSQREIYIRGAMARVRALK